MGAAVPDVEARAQVLRLQQADEKKIIVEEGVLAADGQHDLQRAQPLQPPVAGEIGQEMRRRMEVNILAVIAVEQIVEGLDAQGEVIAAGKGHQLAEQVGMAEGQARGLEGAEATAHGDGAIMPVHRGHERHHFMEDIGLECGVAADTVGGVAAAVVKTFLRQTFDAIELELPGFNLVGQGAHDVELFIFPEAAVARGEHQHLRARVAEDQQLHLPMQPVAVPAPIVSLHLAPKNCLTLSMRRACCACMPG